MSKQKDHVNNLLAAIKRQPTQSTASTEEVERIPDTRTEPKVAAAPPAPRKVRDAKKAKAKHGMPVQFWLHDDDRKTIRELAAWLAGQGLRTTDSQVLRAVLRLAKTGNALVEAYHEASRLDGRRKQD